METSQCGSMLAEAIRQKLPKKTRCKFEIRTVGGGPNRLRAERLQNALSMGGLEAAVVEISTAPAEGILIEGSHELAATVIALQSAFHLAEVPAQALVHEKADPKLIVIHMG